MLKDTVWNQTKCLRIPFGIRQSVYGYRLESDKVFKDAVWNQIKCLRIPFGLRQSV